MQATKMGRVVRITVLSTATFLMLSGIGVPGGSGISAAQRSPAMNSGRPLDPPPTGVPTLGQTPAQGAGANSPEEQERTNEMARDRRKRVAADVDKLVELSNELKTDLDKSGRDELSLDVIKKAQQIEKLAHDVQGRMKN